MRGLGRLGWAVLNLAQAVVLVLVCLLVIPLFGLGSRLVSPRLPLFFARALWAPVILAGAGVRLEVEGGAEIARRASGGALFVANHTSQIDIPALFAALPLPLRFVVKMEHRRLPLVGTFIRSTGMIFVDRRDRRAAREMASRVAAVLARGDALAAFPEGTRSRDGRLRPFKPAVFRAPIATGTPVVPVAIVGADRVLPAGTFRVRPGTVRVIVGEPIDTASLGDGDRRCLAEEAGRRVAAMLAAAGEK